MILGFAVTKVSKSRANSEKQIDQTRRNQNRLGFAVTKTSKSRANSEKQIGQRLVTKIVLVSP